VSTDSKGYATGIGRNQKILNLEKDVREREGEGERYFRWLGVPNTSLISV
jgi:hypothetical protein